MNKNTKIRIKVPKSLYESIQQQIKKESVKTQESGQYYGDRAMKGGIQMENEEPLNEDLANTLWDLARDFGPEAIMAGITALGAKLGFELQKRSDSGVGNRSLDKTMGKGIEGNRFEKPSTMGEKKSHGEEEEGVVKEFSMEQLSEAVKKAKAKKAAAAKEKEKAAAAKEKEKAAAKKEKEKEAAKKK
jgi:hypothetical protein